MSGVNIAHHAVLVYALVMYLFLGFLVIAAMGSSLQWFMKINKLDRILITRYFSGTCVALKRSNKA